MSLVWVADEAAWRLLGASAPGTATLATADAALARRWRREGRPVVDPWEWAPPAVQRAVAEEALALAGAWLRDPPWLLDGGEPLMDLLHTPLLYLARDALLARRLAAGLLDTVQPASLTVVGEGLVEAVLRCAAEVRDLRVAALAGAAVAGGPTLGRSARLRHAWAGARTALALGRSGTAGPAAGPLVLVCGGGSDYSNQLPLVAGLRATGRYRVRHLALHPPRVGAWGDAGGLPPPDAVLPTHGGPASWWRARALGRRARRELAAGRLPDPPACPGWGRDPALLPWLAALLGEALPRAAGALAAARRLLERERPAALLLSSAASARELALLLAARERGLPSAQLVHSGFNDLDVHRVAADALWVWGEAQRRQFLGRGLAPERIAVLGNPALTAPPGPVDESVRAAARTSLGLAADALAVLLITARPPRLHAFLDPVAHGRDLEALAAAVAARPGARLLVKPHPRYDDLGLYEALAADGAPLRLLPANTALGTALAASDLAVALNLGTTGALEAVLAQRPLMWIRSSNAYPASFDLIAPAAAVVERREDIGAAVAALLATPEARAARVAAAGPYLAELLAQPAGGAVQATIEALAELIDGAPGH